LLLPPSPSHRLLRAFEKSSNHLLRLSKSPSFNKKSKGRFSFFPHSSLSKQTMGPHKNSPHSHDTSHRRFVHPTSYIRSISRHVPSSSSSGNTKLMYHTLEPNAAQ
jgi:hypothetical protein